MKYVVAANFRMFKEFLRLFAVGKEDTYKYVSIDNWRGTDRHNTLFILYENYKENEGWTDGNLPQFLDSCTMVYRLEHMDWVL
jgi:hypothetical protein